MADRARLTQLSKVFWVLAFFLIVAYFIYHRGDSLASYLLKIDTRTIALSAGGMILAKVLLSRAMQRAAQKAGIDLSFAQAFWIYNITQLPKYVPGSIWQFVGRATVLKRLGCSLVQIRDSLLIEHIWVIGSAAVLGLPVCVYFGPALLRQFAASAGSGLLIWGGLALLGAGLFVLLALRYLRKKQATLPSLRELRRALRPSLALVLALLACWTLFGFSFWITLGPVAEAAPSLVFAISVYCLAYVAGFCVPFAPAGLGVREAVLIVCLAEFLSLEAAFLVSALNRSLYLLVDVLMGALGAVLWFARARAAKAAQPPRS